MVRYNVGQVGKVWKCTNAKMCENGMMLVLRNC